MIELNYRLRMSAWRDVTIKIKDEEMFKERYKHISNEEHEGGHLHYWEFENEFSEECIEVEYDDLNWDNEDWDELDEVMENYLQKNNEK